METIRLYICDDEEHWCNIFRMIAEPLEDIEIAGAATDSECMLMELEDSGANVLLLDINMKEKYEGVKLIPKIKEKHPDVKIFVLTSYEDEECVFDCFVAGANDYLTKSMTIDQMIKTIRDGVHNDIALRPEIVTKLTAGAKEQSKKNESLLWAVHCLTKLSTSEFEMLKDVCNGMSYSEIAKKRVIEPNSVRMMASRILSKFDVDRMDNLVDMLKKINAFDVFKNI